MSSNVSPSWRAKAYSPEALDERFRTLMRTGLFNVLQIKPVPVDGHLLRLDVSAEEAKSKEFGFSIGYGTYEGAIGGVQWRDRDLFGYGRPLTTSVEVSQRSYKGEILYEDPFFLIRIFLQSSACRVHFRLRWLHEIRIGRAIRAHS